MDVPELVGVNSLLGHAARANHLNGNVGNGDVLAAAGVNNIRCRFFGLNGGSAHWDISGVVDANNMFNCAPNLGGDLSRLGCPQMLGIDMSITAPACRATPPPYDLEVHQSDLGMVVI